MSESDENIRVLVFPKGTIVKYGGIPCELLQDTPYESATIRSQSRNQNASSYDE